MIKIQTTKSSRWYYGWNIVIAASIITLITAGMRMSVGPFFLPILGDFQMTRTDLSLIVATGMLVYGIGMPLAGVLESRWGPKIVLLIGAFIVFGSCIWMMLATSSLDLLMSFGICLSIGLALTSQITLTPIIVKWFIKRRGQALFYLTTGSMAGIAVMNPVSNALIETFSWQWAMLIFGIIFLVLVLITAFFVLRDDVPLNADAGGRLDHTEQVLTAKSQQKDEHMSEVTVWQAVKTLPFWTISIGLFTCGFSMNLLGSHGVPMLVDHGFSSSAAASAIGLIGLVAVPGTLILGSLADKIQKNYMLTLIYGVRGIGFICIVLVISSFQLYLVAIIAGLAWAGNVALSSAILTDVYGVRLVGILYGSAFFFHQIGATISTMLGGWAYERFETHLISFGSAGILLFVAAIVSFSLHVSPFKQNKQSTVA